MLSIEDIFYARNVRTTVVLGHARGVILLAAAQAGMEIHEYPPAEIKKAVAGNGRGDQAAGAVHGDAIAATQVGAAADRRGGRRRGGAGVRASCPICRKSSRCGSATASFQPV